MKITVTNHQFILCNIQFQGTWVARKVLDKEDAKHDKIKACYLNEISDTSDKELKMDGKFHTMSDSEDVEMSVNTNYLELKVIGDNKGRWSIKTDQRFNIIDGEC